MALWKDWFGGRKEENTVPDRLFNAIMSQALQPKFFGSGTISDTFGGRFEITTIHAMLVFRRLRSAGEYGPQLAQDVFALLFSGFDDALREIGTGDLKVGKKIKDIAKAFYGRAESYDAALDEDLTAEPDPLVDVLMRNVQLTSDGSERLAHYIRDADAILKSLTDDELLSGTVSWPTTL